MERLYGKKFDIQNLMEHSFVASSSSIILYCFDHTRYISVGQETTTNK